LGQGDLAGLPSDLVAAAKQAAVDRGQEGYVITLSRYDIALNPLIS
jgi:peptidyl-dipeptidase Dcp